MRDYELMYIVRPTVGDEGFPAVTERVDGFVASIGGEAGEKQVWGKRRLAYPIERHDDGYYIVQKIQLDPGRVGALEELLRIADDVIRHIVVEPVAVPQPRIFRTPQGAPGMPGMPGAQPQQMPQPMMQQAPQPQQMPQPQEAPEAPEAPATPEE